MADRIVVPAQEAPSLETERPYPGRRGGRRYSVRPWWAAGVAAALCVLASGASAASFLLDTGDRVEGEVIHATRNTLMVREKIGAIRQLSLGDVQTVEIATRDGSKISGALLGWRDGVYEIESGERVTRLEDGRIVGEDEAKLPVLVITTAEAAEDAAEMRFEIDLSAPARRSIFLVYGTFDRTAKAGEDYRTERGSLELVAGDSSAVLSIPLIDDDVAEGDETFEVFVSADEKLATIENNRVVGKILNDDD